MVCPTVQNGGTEMISVCIRRPAEILRIIKAARNRDTLAGRQLLQDLGLVFLRKVLQDLDGIVRIQIAHALGDGLRRQFLKNVLAYRDVDFRQRGKVELRPHQFNQKRAMLSVERFQQIAHVGFMQIARECAERGRI